MGRLVDLCTDCTCCDVTLAGPIRDALRDMAFYAHPARGCRNRRGDDSYDRVGLLPWRSAEAGLVDRVVHLLDLPAALRAHRQTVIHAAPAIHCYGGP